MHEDGIVISNVQKANLDLIVKKPNQVPVERQKEIGALEPGPASGAAATDPKTTTPLEIEASATVSGAEISITVPGSGNAASNAPIEETIKQQSSAAMEEVERGTGETANDDGVVAMDDDQDDNDAEEKKEGGLHSDGGATNMEIDDDVPVSTSHSQTNESDGSGERNGMSSKKSSEAKVCNNGGVDKENSTTPMETDATKPDGGSGSGTTAATTLDNSIPAAPPPPVMKGTLSIDLNSQRRHLIRGMWNYEHSTTLPPQRFELVRNLSPTEDANTLPVDGEFHGSFSLAYIHTTSKGKQKERSKVISETGVMIHFTKLDNEKGEYKVDGTGTNQFGVFHIYGTATPSADSSDPTMNIIFRKRYDPGPAVVVVAPVADAGTGRAKSGPDMDVATTDPLAPPFKSFPSGVVALRGNIYKEESSDLGLTEVVHRINGMWASGLDFILADPQNVRGMCNRFEYEHKSSVPTHQFPVSGKYSGWFDLSNEDGTRTRINERDVTLKFRMNNAGYHNIEGKGSNVFGKYTITGTLTTDNVMTIFRHFQPRKLKKSASLQPMDPTAAPVVSNNEIQPSLLVAAPPASAIRRPSVGSTDTKLTLNDVKVPELEPSDEAYDPVVPPPSGTYSAVSRGVLHVNEDGSHTCQGKWAVTREHFTSGQTSNFTFRLEPHFAVEAAGDNGRDSFPLDSAMYKGSFQLKKQGARYQTIIDQQIVMKFRKNKQGSYNVYGTGINAIGEFNLLGTLVATGKSGGHVELYRMYPPDKLAAPKPVAQKAEVPGSADDAISAAPQAASASAPPQQGSLQRRESSRMVKLPSRLEEDDPEAQISRTMDKCAQILKIIRERDVELGAFFSEPVDPVALGIPTYFQVVKEPMDLRTIHRRVESAEIETPEEFARVTRLVFENAMTFNIDPAHSVHQAARDLLVLFNQKFRDVERAVQSIRRTQGIDVDETGKPRSKDDKKRKRSLKRIRLDEAQAMSVAQATSLAALTSATTAASPTTVTRLEFTLLVQMIQQLQQHVVLTHTALADLSPDENGDDSPEFTLQPSLKPVTSTVPTKAKAPVPVPEKKKATKRKNEFEETPIGLPDDSAPLSHEEQEFLTDTINELPQEHIGGVIQIIREATQVGADETELDLEIDQLDNKTQRKLLRHIQKFAKKSKPKPKKPKTSAPPKKTEKPPPEKKAPKVAAAAPKPKAATTDSFFAFGGKDDSDSDDDSDDNEVTTKPSASGPSGGKVFSQSAMNDFNLGDGLDLNDDNDDEIGGTVNWNLAKPAHEEDKAEEGGDDWGAAAREQAAAATARDADRKAREARKKAEAELASKQRLAEAASRGEEIKAQRAEEEAKEEKLREQQEKDAEDARQAAKNEARAQLQSVEQTVDLDAQRDIMKQFEFADKDLGGASPSSDFGF